MTVKNYESFTKKQYFSLIPLEDHYKIGNGVFEDYLPLLDYSLLIFFMHSYNEKCEVVKNKEMYTNDIINKDHFIKE